MRRRTPQLQQQYSLSRWLLCLALLFCLPMPEQHSGSSQGFLQLAAAARPYKASGSENTPAAKKILNVCLFTADFWGLKGAGGTATAYHLLANALSQSEHLNVTLIGVSKEIQRCKKMNNNIPRNDRLWFGCLDKKHFEPKVISTQPYEEVSHATARWLMDNQDGCDVLHAHEWGGVYADMTTLVHFRQMKPGLRIAIEPHGGHFWSTQGLRQRPMDVMSLRIDHGERITTQLADMVLSPTRYMLAFLKQRGWQLPSESYAIPNIISDVEKASPVRIEKPIWRLCFFSRLEERKGIKTFVAAVSRLDVSRLPHFEVVFVGTEGIIDMLPSSRWLKEHTADWKFPTKILINTPRDKALEIISEEGTLLVLASLVDNMPYVLAEAAVKAIPFVVFDIGGVLEMIDPKIHEDIIIWDPNPVDLAEKVYKILERGRLGTAVLQPSVRNGVELWISWHVNYTQRLPDLIKQDELLKQVQASVTPKLDIVRVAREQRSFELYSTVCDKLTKAQDAGTDAILLLPEEYQFLDSTESPAKLLELAQMWATVQRKHDMGGGFTFGVQLPEGELAFPTSPTWMLYDDIEKAQCIENVPILIHRGTFCDTYLAEARSFRVYYSWVLSMMLKQAGSGLHSFPFVAFRIDAFSSYGYSCQYDKIPHMRKISPRNAGDLYKDSEELLRMLHLAPWPRPIVSLRDDFADSQGHKGWSFGYTHNNSDTEPQLMMWKAPPNQEVRDGQWGCEQAYPMMHHFLLHPCAVQGSKACCGHDRSNFNLRFNSFFKAEMATLSLAYEVYPACGDGLQFTVRLTSALSGKSRDVYKKIFQADPKTRPIRERLEWHMNIFPGDLLDFIVDPLTTHDCDGLYIVDIQLWENTAEDQD